MPKRETPRGKGGTVRPSRPRGGSSLGGRPPRRNAPRPPSAILRSFRLNHTRREADHEPEIRSPLAARTPPHGNPHAGNPDRPGTRDPAGTSDREEGSARGDAARRPAR